MCLSKFTTVFCRAFTFAAKPKPRSSACDNPLLAKFERLHRSSRDEEESKRQELEEKRKRALEKRRQQEQIKAEREEARKKLMTKVTRVLSREHLIKSKERMSRELLNGFYGSSTFIYLLTLVASFVDVSALSVGGIIYTESRHTMDQVKKHLHKKFSIRLASPHTVID